MKIANVLSPLTIIPITALTMLGVAGCHPGGDADSDVELSTGALTSGTDVLGFEATAGWKVSSGTVTLSKTAHTQGAAALAVTAPQNYTTLVSNTLASGLAPLAGLTDAGATLQLDLQLPTSQPNPNYFGAVQLYINVPSRGVFNQFLGQSELTGQKVGV